MSRGDCRTPTALMISWVTEPPRSSRTEARSDTYAAPRGTVGVPCQVRVPASETRTVRHDAPSSYETSRLGRRPPSDRPASATDAVLVGSSVAELTAARAAGLSFLGYTRSEGHRQRLLRAGCEVTTASWAPSSAPSPTPEPLGQPGPADGLSATEDAPFEDHPSSRTPPGPPRKATPRQFPHDA
ncbi:hypothetical protein ACIRL0_09330 [Streptomyces sp. NPDC102365]|uniref:hypothetical protein n=1 Tax=Streptomyces sp. NPDC102365 TaxID=3366162 RepID=UPI0038124030